MANLAPTLASIFARRFGDQVELAAALVLRLPADRLLWHPKLPGRPPLAAAGVCDHMHQSLLGVAATLVRHDATRYAGLNRLRDPSPLPDSPAGWNEKLLDGWRRLGPELSALPDTALTARIPTHFRPQGETVADVLFGNLEHLLNHKYQLFFYLRLLGVAVGTPDLYRILAL